MSRADIRSYKRKFVLVDGQVESPEPLPDVVDTTKNDIVDLTTPACSLYLLEEKTLAFRVGGHQLDRTFSAQHGLLYFKSLGEDH